MYSPIRWSCKCFLELEPMGCWCKLCPVSPEQSYSTHIHVVSWVWEPTKVVQPKEMTFTSFCWKCLKNNLNTKSIVCRQLGWAIYIGYHRRDFPYMTAIFRPICATFCRIQLWSQQGFMWSWHSEMMWIRKWCDISKWSVVTISSRCWNDALTQCT